MARATVTDMKTMASTRVEKAGAAAVSLWPKTSVSTRCGANTARASSTVHGMASTPKVWASWRSACEPRWWRMAASGRR